MDDEPRGLYQKYRVFKTHNMEEVLEDFFVLRPARDRAAREALRVYATETSDVKLADEIDAWLARLVIESGE